MLVLFVLPLLVVVSSEPHEYHARVFTDLYDKEPHQQPEDIKVKTDEVHKLKEALLAELDKKGWYTKDDVYSMHTRRLSEIEKSRKGVEIKDDTEAIPWQERLHWNKRFNLYVSKAKKVQLFKLNDVGKSEDLGITIRVRTPMSTRRIIKEAIDAELNKLRKESTKYKDYQYNEIFLSADPIKGETVDYGNINVEKLTHLYLFKATEIDYERDITFNGEKMLKKLSDGTKVVVKDHEIAEGDEIEFEKIPANKVKATLKQYNNGNFETHNEIWEHVIKDQRLKGIAYKMSKLTAIMQDGSQTPLVSNSYARIDCREIKELIASTSAKERIKIRMPQNPVKFIYLGEVATGKYAWEKINSFGDPWNRAVVAYRMNSSGQRTATKVKNEATDFHKTSDFVGLEIAQNVIVQQSPASYEPFTEYSSVRVNLNVQTGNRLGVPQHQRIGGFPQQHGPGFPNNGQFGHNTATRTHKTTGPNLGGLAKMGAKMGNELFNGEEGQGEGEEEGSGGSSHGGSDNDDGAGGGDEE